MGVITLFLNLQNKHPHRTG